MASAPGTRFSPAPPFVSFNDLGAGATSPNFILPKGAGELQYDTIDPNNPGVVTLQQVVAGVTSTVVTLNTGIGDIPGFGGSARFQTLGGTFNLTTTVLADELTIYFAEQVA